MLEKGQLHDVSNQHNIKNMEKIRNRKVSVHQGVDFEKYANTNTNSKLISSTNNPQQSPLDFPTNSERNLFLDNDISERNIFLDNELKNEMHKRESVNAQKPNFENSKTMNIDEAFEIEHGLDPKQNSDHIIYGE